MRHEADWGARLLSLVADERGSDPSGRRRRQRISTSIPLSTYAYPRTPRGVPLLVSPLSQFEDRYIGAVYGGPKGYVVLLPSLEMVPRPHPH
jgi:hypothetical protein